MLHGIIASATVAGALGYRGVGEIILEWQLSPHAIARVFSLGVAHDLGVAGATVLMAGAAARYNVCREGWSGEDPEGTLAQQLLALHADDVGDRLEIARLKAVRLVSDHWVEINATARR